MYQISESYKHNYIIWMPSYLIIFWADFGWFSWTSPLLHYIGWHWSKKIGFLIKLIGNFIRQLCHSQIVASTILNLHFLGNNVNNQLKFSSLSTTSLSQDFGSFIWGIYIPPSPRPPPGERQAVPCYLTSYIIATYVHLWLQNLLEKPSAPCCLWIGL